MANFVGLELLFKQTQPEILRREDAVVCAIHSYLLTCNYKCVGLLSKTSDPSESLPEGWNTDPDVYTLTYRKPDDDSSVEHILKIVRMNKTLIANMLYNSHNEKESTLRSVEINSDEFTNEDTSTFHKTFKNLTALQVKLQSGLSPQQTQPQSSNQKATTSNNQRQDYQSQSPRNPLATGGPSHHPNRPPFRVDPVGGNDLDPFGGNFGGLSGPGGFGGPAGGRPGGGGMYFDPRGLAPGRFDPNTGLPGGMRLPPGAVPPGSRFDPFGPPDNGLPNREPDPDHERPPGFDDMFM